MFSKDRFVHEAPIRFDDLWIFGGQSARHLHFRPKPESVAVRLTIM